VTSSATGQVRLGEECSYDTYTRALERVDRRACQVSKGKQRAASGTGAVVVKRGEGAATVGKDDPGSPGNEPRPSRVAASGDRGSNGSVDATAGVHRCL